MKKILIFCSLILIITISNSLAQESFVVEKTGKGQAILLFPGFACTSEVYDGLKDDLTQDYDVHAFTFAGFGNVPPISFPWLPQIKTEIETYVKENNLKNPIIIGHSLGGTLGLWLTSESETYSKLIVIDALPAMGDLMMQDYNSDSIVYNNPYNDQVLAMDEEVFATTAVQSATYMTSNKDKQKVIADWIIASDRKTYVYGYTDLLKLDLRDSLSKIETPVYILAATEPYGMEAAEAIYQKQYKNLNDYSLKFAEGSGHFIMYDRLEWLQDQIQKALNDNE